MIRLSCISILLLCMAAVPLPAETAPLLTDAEGTLDESRLVEAVLASNASLEAKRHALAAARERIVQAGALDDPMVMVSIAPLSLFGDERFGGSVELRQTLPRRGERSLRERIEGEKAAIASLDLDETAAELELTTRELYGRYLLTAEALAITREHIGLLGEIGESAEAQYVAGRASQSDALAAEVERTELLHREATLASEMRRLGVLINVLLQRDPAATLPPAPAIDSIVPATVGEAQSKLRPELEEADREVRVQTLSVELAKLALRPEIAAIASVSTMFRGAHQYMAGIAMTLPVDREKRRAAVREEEALLAGAISRRDALAQTLAGEVRVQQIEMERLESLLEIYDDRLLPAARDQVAAARSGFTTGRNSFGSLIEAEKNLRGIALRRAEVVAEMLAARARLDRAIGRTAWKESE